MKTFCGEGGNSPSFNNHRTDLNKLHGRVKGEQWEEEGKQAWAERSRRRVEDCEFVSCGIGCSVEA